MSVNGWNPFTPNGANMISGGSVTGGFANGMGPVPLPTADSLATQSNLTGGYGQGTGTYGGYGMPGAWPGQQRPQGEGLSPGEIGAAAVGSVAAVGLLAGGAYLGVKKGMNHFKK